ncbi:MAG: DNA cytosine methyltransferase, partial [Pseudomonadota bacterium]
QDLSLAGNRSGLSASRSGNFWHFWSLMRDLAVEGRAPKLIVIENVPGLLTSSHGADFRAMVTSLTEIGYRCGVLELDAADFVPQSRKRIFVVCARGNVDRELLADKPGYGQQRAVSKDVLEDWKASNLLHWYLPPPMERQSMLIDVLEQAPPRHAWRSEAACDALLDQMTPPHRARVAVAEQHPDPQVGAVYRRVRDGVARAEVRYDGLAGCIRTLKGGSSRQLLLISEAGQTRLRGLTAREAARLMGLPDTYQLPRTLTAATNLAGDGVCVPLVRWLAEHLLHPIVRKVDPSLSIETTLKSAI